MDGVCAALWSGVGSSLFPHEERVTTKHTEYVETDPEHIFSGGEARQTIKDGRWNAEKTLRDLEAGITTPKRADCVATFEFKRRDTGPKSLDPEHNFTARVTVDVSKDGDPLGRTAAQLRVARVFMQCTTEEIPPRSMLRACVEKNLKDTKLT
jgi:hypothetical protein